MTTLISSKKTIQIPYKELILEGELTIPDHPKGLIIFSHGSGSSRFSPRNNMVAERLQDNGFATLLFDLLTEEEDRIYENRFNIPLLSERLVHATHWIKDQPVYTGAGVSYFGASTGAASALFAAAELGPTVKAVVSRGGRPDLANVVAGHVTAPTLLLVGSLDRVVIGLNEKFFDLLRAPKELKIIEGASHLFEEPGKLEEVASAATRWFLKYMV